MSLPTLKRFRTALVALSFASLLFSLPARAGTIDISYTLTGTTTITGITSTTAYLSGVNTGTMSEGNPTVDATSNPVSFSYSSQAALATGLLTGNFTFAFANGEQLSGVVNENIGAILLSPTRTGPYTQTLLFTSGTGEFAGVSGSASGTGYVGPVTGTVSGSGTLSAAALAAPEPASINLMLGGVTFLVTGYRRRCMGLDTGA